MLHKEHSTRAQTSTFGFNWHGGWEGILKTLWKLFKEEKFIAVVMMLNDWWKNEEIIVAWRLHNEQNRFRHKHYLCDVCRRPGLEEIFEFDFRSMRFPNVGGNVFSWFAFTGEAAMKIKRDDWRCHNYQCVYNCRMHEMKYQLMFFIDNFIWVRSRSWDFWTYFDWSPQEVARLKMNLCSWFNHRRSRWFNTEMTRTSWLWDLVVSMTTIGTRELFLVF